MSFLKSILVSYFVLISISATADHVIVDQWEFIPEVSVELIEDSHSGWNLRVDSSNFVFDPVNVGGQHQVGHGHGHLYVNGKKITRIYNQWTHIPVGWLNKGHNKVEVTLNANTHEELFYKNLVISDSKMIYFNGGLDGGHHH